MMGDDTVPVETLASICRAHRHDDFHLADTLSDDKLRMVHDRFIIPAEDAVGAVYDTTFWQQLRAGLVICSSGLYWGSALPCSKRRTYLPWSGLASDSIEARGRALQVKDKKFRLTDESGAEMLACLLWDIRRALAGKPWEAEHHGRQPVHPTAQGHREYVSSPFDATYGVRLSYAIEGRGIPCLVCTTGIVRETLSETLRAHLELVFARIEPTHGHNPGAVQPLSTEALAESLEVVRRELGIPRVAVLGHGNMGGLGALAYAISYPRSTSHVILLAANPRATSAYRDRTRHLIERYWETEATPERKAYHEEARKDYPKGLAFAIAYGADEEAVEEYGWICGHSCDRAEAWYDMQSDPYMLWYQNSGESWLGRLDEDGGTLWHPDLAGSLDRVGAPVFVAAGTYDFVDPPVLWEGLLETFRGVDYHLFEQSGHYPHYEEQQRFDSTLLDWLAHHEET